MTIKEFCEKNFFEYDTVITALNYAKVNYSDETDYEEKDLEKAYYNSCDILISQLDCFTISGVASIFSVSIQIVFNYLKIMGYINAENKPSELGIQLGYFISDRDLLFTIKGVRRLSETFGSKAVEKAADKFIEKEFGEK